MKIILDSRTDRVRIVDSPNREDDILEEEGEEVLDQRDPRAEGAPGTNPMLDRGALFPTPIVFHPRFPESGAR